MFRIGNDSKNNQWVKVNHSTKDIIKYYSFNIDLLEVSLSVPFDDRLSKRERDFLVCTLACIDSGCRNILSEECLDIFSKIGKFEDHQEIRIYSNKKRIKRWLKKDKVNSKAYYKLPPILEGLLKFKNTNYNININWDWDDEVKEIG